MESRVFVLVLMPILDPYLSYTEVAGNVFFHLLGRLVPHLLSNRCIRVI